MEQNPYESPPLLASDAGGAKSTAEQLARRRAPTGPSSRWWGMLALGIGAALFLFWVPGLGLLVALVSAPLLFFAARRDCQLPHREPLRLAGQVAAAIGVLFASGAAFAGICLPMGFTAFILDFPIPRANSARQDAFELRDLILYSGMTLGGVAALGVLYAGFRTIRAARYAATNSLAQSDEAH